MKHLKTYENLNRTAKEEIKNMVERVVVNLEKVYLYNEYDDKDYYREIDSGSIENSATKITNFIINVANLNDEQYDYHYDNIIDYLKDLEMCDDEDELELDENSVEEVTDDIYNYIDEYLDYELDEKYELFKATKNYNI